MLEVNSDLYGRTHWKLKVQADSHVAGDRIRIRPTINCFISMKGILIVISLILEHVLFIQCRKTSTL